MTIDELNTSFKIGEKFEKVVAELILQRGTANIRVATKNENKYDHIDFFIVPNDKSKKELSIDVKGLKRYQRENTYYQDEKVCLEFKNEWGYSGWLYGKADFIAFCRFDKVIFIPLKTLRRFAEQIKNKNWDKFYRPKKPLEGFHPELEQPFGKARKYKKDSNGKLIDSGQAEDVLINVSWEKIEKELEYKCIKTDLDTYRKYGIKC